MNRRILKFIITPNDEITENLPSGTKPVYVDEQDGNVVVWVEVPESNEYTLTQKYTFVIVGTGHWYTNDFLVYAGTAKVGIFVWHVLYQVT